MSPILILVHIVEFGYVQLAPSVGISYIAAVLPRIEQARCPRDDLGVMLKVALGDFLDDPLGEKGDRKGMRAGSTSKRKSSLALEKGRFKRTGHC